MNKKSIIASILVVLLFIGIVAYGIYYRNNTYDEIWVECKYQGDEDNFDESLRFRYLVSTDDMITMYGFYHDIEITPENEEEKNKTIERYNTIYEPFKEASSNNLTYELNEKDGKIIINVYMNTALMSTTFNNYIKDTYNIKSTTKYKDIEKELTNNSFVCKIKKV